MTSSSCQCEEQEPYLSSFCSAVATRRCLVVGSTGYVGAAISEKLILSGWAAAGAKLLWATGVEPVLTPRASWTAVAATASSCGVVIDVVWSSFKTRTKVAQIIIDAERKGGSCGHNGHQFLRTVHASGQWQHDDWPYTLHLWLSAAARLQSSQHSNGLSNVLM